MFYISLTRGLFILIFFEDLIFASMIFFVALFPIALISTLTFFLLSACFGLILCVCFKLPEVRPYITDFKPFYSNVILYKCKLAACHIFCFPFHQFYVLFSLTLLPYGFFRNMFSFQVCRDFAYIFLWLMYSLILLSSGNILYMISTLKFSRFVLWPRL